MATKALTTTSLRLCGDLSFCCDPQNSTAAQQLQKTVWEPAKSINKSVWQWDRIPQLDDSTHHRVLQRSNTQMLPFRRPAEGVVTCSRKQVSFMAWQWRHRNGGSAVMTYRERPAQIRCLQAELTCRASENATLERRWVTWHAGCD